MRLYIWAGVRFTGGMVDALRMTGAGMGAIAVVMVTGEGARRAVEAIGGTIPNDVGGVRRARLGTVAGAIDDGLVVRVGAERFELHLHGGVAVVDAIVTALRDAGVTVVEPGDAARLLGSGLEAEMEVALAGAVTETAVRLLANQPGAGVGAWVGMWVAKLSAGESLTSFQSQAQWLLTRSRTLDLLLAAPRIAIVGPPNAGKSTLANALLGRAMSITSNMAGTTRDWVDAVTVLEGAGERGQGSGRDKVSVPVTLIDTAGIRETADAIEVESIRRTHAQVHGADVAIVVVDAGLPINAATQSLLAGLRIPAVVALNKIDAGKRLAAVVGPPTVGISALNREGLPGLMAAVLAQLDLADIGLAEPWVFTARQRAIVAAAALAPTAGEAIAALQSILNP